MLHLINGVKSRWYRFFNLWKFRCLGVRLGQKADIRNKIYLEVGENSLVTIGDHFLLLSGDNLSPLCHDTSASIRVCPNAKLTIGDNCGISGGTIWVTKNVTIGDYVNIGGNCCIMDGDIHNIDWRLRRVDRQQNVSYKSSDIVISDDVWMGANCTVLKGVHIGPRSVIGAGSVVVSDIPADCIAAGNPCRVIKYLNTHES